MICTTPRSGSTLLCALLAASGVAGRPESFYRAEDRAEYAQDWGVPLDANGTPDPAAYLAGTLRAGTDTSGTFALRTQGQSHLAMLAELRALFADAPTDRALMERAFGPCRFIHLQRRDDVAQAVSQLKAEVSLVWHLDGTEGPPLARATYDAARLDGFRAEAAAGNAMFKAWFASEGITPLHLSYEDFASDPVARTHALLATFGLTPAAPLTVPNRRMADATSVAWAARYRAERGLAPLGTGQSKS